MSESVKKEIDKRYLRGIAASPGIVIGKAYLFQDILLLVERGDSRRKCWQNIITR